MDGSLVRLVAILSQVDAKTKERTSANMQAAQSRNTDQRDSQTERKAHDVVWTCEHVHLYIYGKLITVYNDHKPLVSIYGNPSSKPSARIELWAFRLPS